MLGSLNEKKALVYFASGMTRNGVDNQAQLQATINAAIRANVAFYPIDARGLVAPAPLGDATKGSPGGQGMYSGSSARGRHQQLPGPAGNALHAGRRHRRQGAARQQRPLHGHRAGAEGHFELLHPRLLLHQRRAGRPFPPHQDLAEDSTSQRQVRQASITAQGYFAGKEFSKFTSSDKERQLSEALMLGDPVTDIDIAMEDRLLPPGARPVLRSGGGQDSGQRAGAGQATAAPRAPASISSARSRTRRADIVQNVRDNMRCQAQGRDRRATGQEPAGLRHRLHAGARHLHHEIPGARKRDRQDGHLRNQVRDSRSHHRTEAACLSAPWC